MGTGQASGSDIYPPRKRQETRCEMSGVESMKIRCRFNVGSKKAARPFDVEKMSIRSLFFAVGTKMSSIQILASQSLLLVILGKEATISTCRRRDVAV